MYHVTQFYSPSRRDVTAIVTERLQHAEALSSPWVPILFSKDFDGALKMTSVKDDDRKSVLEYLLLISFLVGEEDGSSRMINRDRRENSKIATDVVEPVSSHRVSQLTTLTPFDIAKGIFRINYLLDRNKELLMSIVPTL